MPGPITVFSARKIITMDPAVEEATHVAVRDGVVTEVGDLDDCAAWGAYTLDDRFGGSVLIPGMIESHAHLLDGLLWAKAEYVGPVDRHDPSGRLRKGINDGSLVLEENHVMAELVLAVRDKKQSKKLKKEKAEKSQSRMRTSLYNRLFKSREASQIRDLGSASSDSSSEEDQENQSRPLNASGD